MHFAKHCHQPMGFVQGLQRRRCWCFIAKSVMFRCCWAFSRFLIFVDLHGCVCPLHCKVYCLGLEHFLCLFQHPAKVFERFLYYTQNFPYLRAAFPRRLIRKSSFRFYSIRSRIWDNSFIFVQVPLSDFLHLSFIPIRRKTTAATIIMTSESIPTSQNSKSQVSHAFI